MPENKPPEWDNDPLSRFFAEAEFNDRVTALNFVALYRVLQDTHELFLRLNEAIGGINREELLVPRLLMVRVHSSFLASIRLAMSGQIVEAFPVLRAAVEQTWYALHIAKDPIPPDRARIWLNRNQTDAEKSRSKAEFMVKNVKDTHARLDNPTAKIMHGLYEKLIDFGAHPNQFGVMASTSISETVEQINFSVGILAPKSELIVFVVRVAIDVAISALKVFQLIFPSEFTLSKIDQRIETLISSSNEKFHQYRPKP